MPGYYEYRCVREVTPLPDYQLRVLFDDGSSKVFDVRPYLDDPFWAPLREQALFCQVYPDGLSVAWPGGIDIAPEEVWHQAS